MIESIWKKNKVEHLYLCYKATKKIKTNKKKIASFARGLQNIKYFKEHQKIVFFFYIIHCKKANENYDDVIKQTNYIDKQQIL